MKKRANKEIIERYLLGELSEEEQLQLAEKYFADDSVFQQLAAVQNELMDQYARNELSPQRRERFERFVEKLPEGRQELEFSNALKRYVSEEKQQAEPAPGEARSQRVSWSQSPLTVLYRQKLALGYSLAMLLVLAIAVPALFVYAVRQRTKLERIQAEQAMLQQRLSEQQQQLAQLREYETIEQERERQERARLEQQLASLQQLQSPTAPFVLTPSSSRDAAKPTPLALPRLRVQLLIEDDDQYKSYRAIVDTPEGERVFQQGRLQARSTKLGRAVILSFPSNRLIKDSYKLTLIGIRGDGTAEDVGYYYFSIAKR